MELKTFPVLWNIVHPKLNRWSCSCQYYTQIYTNSEAFTAIKVCKFWTKLSGKCGILNNFGLIKWDGEWTRLGGWITLQCSVDLPTPTPLGSTFNIEKYNKSFNSVTKHKHTQDTRLIPHMTDRSIQYQSSRVDVASGYVHNPTIFGNDYISM